MCVCTSVHVCKVREAHRERIPGRADCVCKGPGAGGSRGYLRKHFKGLRWLYLSGVKVRMGPGLTGPWAMVSSSDFSLKDNGF